MSPAGTAAGLHASGGEVLPYFCGRVESFTVRFVSLPIKAFATR